MLSLAQLQLVAPVWMNTSSDIFNDEQAHKVTLALTNLQLICSLQSQPTINALQPNHISHLVAPVVLKVRLPTGH